MPKLTLNKKSKVQNRQLKKKITIIKLVTWYIRGYDQKKSLKVEIFSFKSQNNLLIWGNSSYFI